MTLLLALVLSLTPRAFAAESEIKAVPFLETPVTADLGALQTPQIALEGPQLVPGVGLIVPSIAASPAAAIQTTLVPSISAAATMPNAANNAPVSLRETLAAQNEIVSRALGTDQSGFGAKAGVDEIYFGKGPSRGGSYAGSFQRPSAAPTEETVTLEGLTIGVPGERGRTDPSSPGATFILNDERIPLTGRAADYFQEAKRLEKVLIPKLKAQGRDLNESTDVMDDAVRDTLGKLKIIEKVGAQDSLAQNVHLPETLTWVDAVTVKNGEKTAVHTTQVYFHHADGSMKSASEIAEGIRRVDKAIEQQLEFFKAGGKADQEIAKVDESDPTPLDKVILGFDARGYQEIKDHIKAKEAAIRAEHGDRFSFTFLDDKDSALSKEEVRAQLTAMVKKYKGHGLQRIIEGVTYSRYTGLLLELKGIEWRLAQGATIIQSGRDMFNDGVDDPARLGMYETELDVVSRALDGKLDMDEEKSARVVLDQDDVLNDKFLYKLEAYKRNRGLIARVSGGVPRINFVIDVGGIDRQAAYAGEVKWKNPRQLELVRFLQSKEKELSEHYGFEVKFVFLSSYPGVDPLLMEKWLQVNSDPENDKAVLKAQRREAKKEAKRRR